jgi:hypothetical protein
MKSRLQRVLKAAKQPARLLKFPDGTQLLVLIHGGRVLGLFPSRDENNFLWTHAALASAATARAFYKSDEWHNSGGERTWLSPEIDVFFPHYPKLDRYWQPRELDPAHYRVEKAARPFTVGTPVKLTFSRTQAVGKFSIAKAFSPAPDPLRQERLPNVNRLRYAGYTQAVTLRTVKYNHKHPAALSLWSLLQLPHGGDMIIPSYGKANVEVFMGHVPRQSLTVREGLTRWKMKAKGEHKISVRAPGCTGRVGYLHRSSARQWDLVVRNFYVNPSGHYPEVPWSRPAEVGHCVQACNVNSGLGQFSELEYHAPAISIGAPDRQHGQDSCQDVSQVWAYRGAPSSIRQAAKSLLGSTL